MQLAAGCCTMLLEYTARKEQQKGAQEHDQSLDQFSVVDLCHQYSRHRHHRLCGVQDPRDHARHPRHAAGQGRRCAARVFRAQRCARAFHRQLGARAAADHVHRRHSRRLCAGAQACPGAARHRRYLCAQPSSFGQRPRRPSGAADLRLYDRRQRLAHRRAHRRHP